MKKILILFAHPALEKSRVNVHLLQAAANLEAVTVNDLYQAYPDHMIDVEREQRLLAEHDVIVFQHPFYWYSTPAILKEWQDLVLEWGFAYGTGGTALQNKIMFNCMTAGGSEETYRKRGTNRFTIQQLLAPIEQTAYLCAMHYLPPFVVHNTGQVTQQDILVASQQYQRLLKRLAADQVDIKRALKQERLNQNMDKLFRQAASQL